MAKTFSAIPSAISQADPVAMGFCSRVGAKNASPLSRVTMPASSAVTPAVSSLFPFSPHGRERLPVEDVPRMSIVRWVAAASLVRACPWFLRPHSPSRRLHLLRRAVPPMRSARRGSAASMDCVSHRCRSRTSLPSAGTLGSRVANSVMRAWGIVMRPMPFVVSIALLVAVETASSIPHWKPVTMAISRVGTVAPLSVTSSCKQLPLPRPFPIPSSSFLSIPKLRLRIQIQTPTLDKSSCQNRNEVSLLCHLKPLPPAPRQSASWLRVQRRGMLS